MRHMRMCGYGSDVLAQRICSPDISNEDPESRHYLFRVYTNTAAQKARRPHLQQRALLVHRDQPVNEALCNREDQRFTPAPATLFFSLSISIFPKERLVVLSREKGFAKEESLAASNTRTALAVPQTPASAPPGQLVHEEELAGRGTNHRAWSNSHGAHLGCAEQRDRRLEEERANLVV